MLKIRLSRVGKKRQPSYRVVVADARSPRDGRYVDLIGYYNPRTEPTTFEVDEDKARDWMSKGAQPTDRVEKLFAGRGLVPARDWGAASAPPKTATPSRASRGIVDAPPAAEEPATPVAVAPVAEPEAGAEPEAAAEPEVAAEPVAEAEAEAEAAPDAEAKPETEA